MNVSDSERVAAVFEKLKIRQAKDEKTADFIVINACSVRQTAIDRIWGLIKNFEKINQHRRLVTILTGCLLPEDRRKFEQKFDFVFNIKELSRLESFLRHRHALVKEQYFSILPKTADTFRAYVPIMTGCNNYCSYCAVPYVRGRELSRSVEEVLSEIKALAAGGTKEITLLGQNVNSYQPKDKVNFSRENPFKQCFACLLWEVNQLAGLERINFVSSHPKDLRPDVIRALSLPKQVNYLHLALQSGDNQVLKKMNRRYTAGDFARLIKKVRKVKPDIAIGTDIIVGFPGETRKQFERTLDFYKKIKFDISYNAMYSPRSGTAAAKLLDNVPLAEKKRRWHELQTLMEKIAYEKNQKYVGKTVSVLVDSCQTDYCEGNSWEMKRVRIKPRRDSKPGEIVAARIDGAKEWILLGRAVGA